MAFWKRNCPGGALQNLQQVLDAGFRISDLLPLEQQPLSGTLMEMRVASGVEESAGISGKIHRTPTGHSQ